MRAGAPRSGAHTTQVGLLPGCDAQPLGSPTCVWWWFACEVRQPGVVLPSWKSKRSAPLCGRTPQGPLRHRGCAATGGATAAEPLAVNLRRPRRPGLLQILCATGPFSPMLPLCCFSHFMRLCPTAFYGVITAVGLLCQHSQRARHHLLNCRCLAQSAPCSSPSPI